MTEIKEEVSFRERINEHVRIINRQDMDSFAASYREDAVAHDPMYPEPLRGRDAIRRDMEDFIRAFPDLKGTLGWYVESGDTAVYEVVARGTHQGPLAGPGGSIPPTSRTMVMPVATFVRFDDQGLIAEERRYYDQAGVMQQLGVMP